MKSTVFKVILVLFCVFFLGFLFTTSFFVRPCSDDLFFYSEFNEKGWFDSIWSLQTNIRFTGFYIFNTIAMLTEDFESFSSNLFIYYFSVFTILILASLYFFKFLSNKILIQRDILFLPVISILYLTSSYFSGIHAQEIWFWTIANTIYFLPIPILFFAIPITWKKGIISNFLFYLLLVLLGGMVENLVLCIIACLLFTLIYFRNSKKNSVKISLSILCLLIFPFFSYLKSGISFRVQSETIYKNENGFFNSVFSDYSLQLNSDRLIFIVFIYLLVMVFSNSIKDKVLLPEFNWKKTAILNIILLSIISLCTFLPMIYVFGNFGPARSSMPFVFSVNSSLFFWCFVIGQRINLKLYLSILISSISLILIIVFYYIQFALTSNFAKKYDERFILIKSQSHINQKYILLPPLPDSGIIPSQELNKLGEQPGMTSYYLGRLLGVDKDCYLK